MYFLDLLIDSMYENGRCSKLLVWLQPAGGVKLRIAADDVRAEVPVQVLPEPVRRDKVQGKVQVVKEKVEVKRKRRCRTPPKAACNSGTVMCRSGTGLSEPPPPLQCTRTAYVYSTAYVKTKKPTMAAHPAPRPRRLSNVDCPPSLHPAETLLAFPRGATRQRKVSAPPPCVSREVPGLWPSFEAEKHRAVPVF